MALGDYILCCKCEVKLIYDGDRGQREWWEERFGKPPEIECPDCKAPASKPVYVAEQRAQPSQSRSDVKPLTDEMITAGARALCKQMAEACGVDARDQWQLYADTFKEDAKAVLEAAHGIKGDA